MTCDEEDLERLGFVEGPVLYPHHAWDNLSTPVVASAVSCNSYGTGHGSSDSGFVM